MKLNMSLILETKQIHLFLTFVIKSLHDLKLIEIIELNKYQISQH